MLSRTDNMTQSLQDWIVSKLSMAGYGGNYVMEDEYPADRQSPLEKTILVFAHDDTDETVEAELGGPLSFTSRTFQLDVLGEDARWGRNIAAIVKDALESGEPIPLNDYSSGVAVEIDKIFRLIAIHTKLRFTNPQPWQLHWNVVTFTIEDEHSRGYLA